MNKEPVPFYLRVVSVCAQLIEIKEKPNAVGAKKAQKGGFDPAIRADSRQTLIRGRGASRHREHARSCLVWFLATAGLVASSSCSDGGEEIVSQVQNKQLTVRDTSIKQAEPETAEGQAGSQVDEAKLIETFQTSVHPLVVQRCSGCHASKVGPYFAEPNAVKAYTAITQGAKVDFVTPSNSRVVQRLAIEGHNCWSDCAGNSAEMRAAVGKWVSESGVSGGETTEYSLVTPEVVKPNMVKAYEQSTPPAVTELVIEAETVTLPKNWEKLTQTSNAQNPAAFDYIMATQGGNTLTVEEVANAQGIAEFSLTFFVPNSGRFTLYARGAGLTNSDNQFFYRVDSDKTWKIGSFDRSGTYKYTRFDTRDWQPGPHTVTIRQRSANIRIDKFAAITRAPNAGNVLTNLTDLTGQATPLSEKFMTFDLSTLTGVPDSQLVVLAEALTPRSYHFTAPFIRMPDASKAFHIEGIRPLINGVFTPQHTHWAGLDFFVKAPLTAVTEIGMTLVADKGPAEDKISFAFEKFEAVDPAAVDQDEE